MAPVIMVKCGRNSAYMVVTLFIIWQLHREVTPIQTAITQSRIMLVNVYNIDRNTQCCFLSAPSFYKFYHNSEISIRHLENICLLITGQICLSKTLI